MNMCAGQNMIFIHYSFGRTNAAMDACAAVFAAKKPPNLRKFVTQSYAPLTVLAITTAYKTFKPNSNQKNCVRALGKIQIRGGWSTIADLLYPVKCYSQYSYSLIQNMRRSVFPVEE